MIPENFLHAIATEYRVSKAELEALSLAMRGESIGGIARQLNIREDAVRKRLSEVYQKFQIAGRGPVKLTQLQQKLVRQYQEKMEVGATYGNRDRQAGNRPSIDWDGAPDVSVFYGRTLELERLNDWIVNQGCRLITIQGMGGIGKTALGVKLAGRIQEHFDYLIWRSLSHWPPLEEFLGDIIDSLGYQGGCTHLPAADSQINSLIKHLRSYRCLLILDGVESILSGRKLAGTYRQGYEKYGHLLRRIAEEPVKSCVLLTSREKIHTLSFLEGESSAVRSLRLEGLGEIANLILKEKGLSAPEHWQFLIQSYRGNPLMLKLVASTIKEVCEGNVSEFLETTLFTQDVTDFVRGLLDSLSELEVKIIVQIARQETSVSLKQLTTQISAVPPSNILSAITSLRERSLVEKVNSGFTLAPVMREVTLNLVDRDLI
jgi:DNA-binding CsgD family transcriptional regulator